MNQKLFIILAVICNVLFLFVYIHKQNWLIQLSYQKQKNESTLSELKQKKIDLENELHLQRSPHSIKKNANKMGMNKAQLTTIKKIGTCKPPAHR